MVQEVFNMKKVLIIGKNSYIGKNFCSYAKKYSDISIEAVGASNGEWKEKSFKGYDSVLFLAGKVHQKETKQNQHEYDEINYKLAIEVAKKAQLSGIQQFIYMSTAAVYGDAGQQKGSVIIDENTIVEPNTAYGKSKRKAEISLLELEEQWQQDENKMKVCIVRPPMVYGKECPGNFTRLYHLALKTPIFPMVHNQRSMIAIDNLCEFLYQLITQEKSGTYHPQDLDYIETSKLVGYMRKVNGKGILYTKKLNPFLSVAVNKIAIVEKVFGNYVYVKRISRYEGMEYQVTDVRKVLKKMKKKS